MISKNDIAAHAWPLARLDEAIETLNRRAGIPITAGDHFFLPSAVEHDLDEEFAPWLEWLGERAGFEGKPIDMTVADCESRLIASGPTLLFCRQAGTVDILVMLKCTRRSAHLLRPDLRIARVSPADIRRALSEELEQPHRAEVTRLVALAGVAPDRAADVSDVLMRDRLATYRLEGAWTFRINPSAAFAQQVWKSRLPALFAGMLGVFVVVYALELLGWKIIGEAALDGRLDLAWLIGWVLLVVSIVPIRIVGSFFDAHLGLGAGTLLKRRLLVGAMKLDSDEIKHQGVGQLLGRVMEMQAFETLAISGAFTSVVALIELTFAAWVLGMGAGGLPHVALMIGWLALGVFFSARYGQQLSNWTKHRLDMTHALIERMVGHRTVLVQERAERRDRAEDVAMKNYLLHSQGMDRAVTPFLAGVPSGWMVVGLIGLVPSFILGTGTPAGFAIGIGGIFLAHRAFTAIAGGLTAAGLATIAWKQVRPLFKAAGTKAEPSPYVSRAQIAAKPGSETSPLIEVERLQYHHRNRARMIVDGASVTIGRNEKVLVEGPSGSGKSTFAALLSGLRKATGGLILMNGLDGRTIGEAWHRFATQAPQFHENHIVSGTLSFNLLMGRAWPPRESDLSEAKKICEELGLGELIARMPLGLMQMVGETGWQLSHGERSRVFLARALLQGTELTILDETFAALDPETAAQCLACANQRSKALIVIAHP